jgi:thiosulfate/3-mercaptopyruvate sulfurtransferase
MRPLITGYQLQELLDRGETPLICDCRFDLSQLSAGREAYVLGHIPGAIYVDLEADLSGTKTGTNGRHPLPTPHQWAKTRQRLGMESDVHVIVYDSHGALFASRLWWMLRAVGHQEVQVLDGGLDAWNRTLDTTWANPVPLATCPADVPYDGLVVLDDIVSNLATRQKLVLDARSSDRFHGQNETLDPVGGHIPGSLNRFCKTNLDGNTFAAPARLRSEFLTLLGEANASEVIHSCGSGVTACHNLLAMEYAGLHGSSLYAGSWSEWCADPSRPVEH